MDIRLAMLDVDGTLMHEGEWFDGSLELVRALDAAGIAVALCSGRAIDSLQVTGSRVPEVSYLAGAGGSIAKRRDGDVWRTIGERFIPAGLVREVVRRGADVGMEQWAYSNERWYVTERTPRVVYDEGFTHATATVEPFEAREDIVKILLFCDTPEQAALRDDVATWEGIGVASSYPGYYDMLPQSSLDTKGGDLLVEAVGCSWDQVLAVGDGPNDLGMLERAGLAYGLHERVAAELPDGQPHQVRTFGGGIADVLADLRERGVVA